LKSRNLPFKDYSDLWRWSVTDLEGFWTAIWDFFEVKATKPFEYVLDRRAMPGARWFGGARLNFAEHLLRHASDDEERVAFLAYSEIRPPLQISVRELAQRVRTVATRLRALGVRPGDRVVCVMPNVPETAIAMIATLAIGAIWSSAAPEFGTKMVIERFAQVAPKVLFTVDGYRFGGKDFSRKGANSEIEDALPTIEAVIQLAYLDPNHRLESDGKHWDWGAFSSGEAIPADMFEFEQVDASAPLWIAFSSGTTGLPKAIVHSHGGVLLEVLKSTGLHLDWSGKDRIFFYCSTGWLVWNMQICCLLQGSTAVLFDGSPSYPSHDILWQVAAETGTTCMGASPSYLQILEKTSVVPKAISDLSKLRTLFLTGSPVTPKTSAWAYENIGSHIWLAIQSGGTELATAIATSLPMHPVYAGEMQVRGLGVDAHAWNEDGEEVTDEVGELVITSPMPSMPIFFWNDADGQRYKDSYFSKFENVWTHGDRIKINRRGGCYIYGRSDAVLNRHGIRIGTAEIYRALDHVEEIADSLAVCIELQDGGFYMPLFVQLGQNVTLSDAMREQIRRVLRRDCGPRHVPDEIIQVDAVPYTITGKKLEIPVRKIMLGMPLEQAAGTGAIRNPEALDWFVAFATTMPR
jgi:acetoacetyl-CoA synthetase